MKRFLVIHIQTRKLIFWDNMQITQRLDLETWSTFQSDTVKFFGSDHFLSYDIIFWMCRHNQKKMNIRKNEDREGEKWSEASKCIETKCES